MPDLLEYLNRESDFGFELRTLKLLRSFGLECEHGGLYEDPLTRRARQFDVRAVARLSPHCVRLAVECKNIGEHFPLLVSCVPRHPDESFHEIAICGVLADGPHAYGALEARAHVVRLEDDDSLYKPGGPVGKSLAQVGRAKDGELHAVDSEVFDKWAQCLASADDLVSRSYYEGSEDHPTVRYVAVIPMLVVPDGRLWIVSFDSDGKRQTEPTECKHCTLFVNRDYRMDLQGPTLTLSHIELVTPTGLAEFVARHLIDPTAIQTIFAPEVIHDTEEELLSGR